MKVQLKQAVCLEGKDYKKGTHEIPDIAGDSWFFKALEKDGVVVVTEPAVATVTTVEKTTNPIPKKVFKPIPKKALRKASGGQASVQVGVP